MLTILRKLRFSVLQLPQSCSCSKTLHHLRVERTQTYTSSHRTDVNSTEWMKEIHITGKMHTYACVHYLQYWFQSKRCTWGTMRALPQSCSGWPSEGLLCTALTRSWGYHWDQSKTQRHTVFWLLQHLASLLLPDTAAIILIIVWAPARWGKW